MKPVLDKEMPISINYFTVNISQYLSALEVEKLKKTENVI